MLLKGYINRGFIKQIILKDKKPKSIRTPRKFYIPFGSIKVYNRPEVDKSDVEVILKIPNKYKKI